MEKLLFLSVFFYIVSSILAAEPSLVVNPNKIVIGLETDLSVRCGFNKSNVADATSLVSLVLSAKSTTAAKYTELASYNALSKKVITFGTITSKISGGVAPSGQVYLLSEWTFPGQTEAGSYKCEASYLNSRGHTVMLTSVAQITSEQPTMDAMFGLFRKVQSQQYDMKKKLSGVASGTGLNSRFKKASDMYFDKNFDFQGHKYGVGSYAALSANRAQATCMFFGGYLVEINTAAELAKIESVLQSYTRRANEVYIGMTDRDHEGTWTFSRNTTTTKPYLSWNSGEPDGSTSYNCATLSQSGSNWKMSDTYCNYYGDIWFICEFE